MLYTPNDNFMPVMKSLLPYLIIDGESIQNALAFLNPAKDRDLSVLSGIKQQHLVSVPYNAHTMMKTAVKAVNGTESDELRDRFFLLLYQLFGNEMYQALWKFGLILRRNKDTPGFDEEALPDLLRHAFQPIYGDDTDAVILAIYFTSLSAGRHLFLEKTTPEQYLRAAELTSRSDDRETHLMLLAHVFQSLPTDGSGQATADRALAIMDNMPPIALKPAGPLVCTLLAEASYFSADYKARFHEDIAGCVNKTVEYVLSHCADTSRAMGAILHAPTVVKENMLRDTVEKYKRSTAIQPFLQTFAAEYTDKYLSVMYTAQDLDMMQLLEEQLRAVKPDAAPDASKLRSIAQQQTAKLVAGLFGTNDDSILAYLNGDMPFSELYPLIENAVPSNASYHMQNFYFRVYGMDDFLARCVCVLSTCEEKYSGVLYHYIGFGIRSYLTGIIDKLFSGGMNAYQVLRACGNMLDNLYGAPDDEIAEIAKYAGDHTNAIAEADLKGLSVTARVLYIAILTQNTPKYKQQLLALAGDSGKTIRTAVVDAAAGQPEWRDDIAELLKSRKSAIREFAVAVMEKQGTAQYAEVLTDALAAEKSDKLKTRIAALLGMASGETKEKPALSTDALIADLTKGVKTKKLEWLFQVPYAPVHLADGGEAPLAYIQALMLCFANDVGTKNPAADSILQLLNPKDAENCALETLSRWLDADAPAKAKWVLYFAAVCGGTEAIASLLHHIDYWPLHQRGAIAAEATCAIALNGSSHALMLVDNMSRKHKFKSIRKAANDALLNAADKLGITKEELADRIIPDLGFDEKMCRVFDYGSRQFQVYLTPTLEAEVYCGEKKLKNMPKPGANDDAALAEKAYNDFKDMKKQMKTAVAAQKARLEYVLLCERKWNSAGWNKLFVQNPIMHAFAIGLIWGIYENGKLQTCFRYLDDGSFTTVDEDELTLPENAEIGLVHPVELSDDALAAWKEQLSDYEITQPVPQLDRTVYRITDAEKQADKISRFSGMQLDSAVLTGRMLKYGWEKGQAQDAGCFYEFCREDLIRRGEGYAAELKFSGTYIQTFGYESENVTVEELCFFLPGGKKIPAGDVSARYFSEVIAQLTAVTKNASSDAV